MTKMENLFKIVIRLLTLIFVISACSPKDECDCSHENVCVTIINATKQPIKTVILRHLYTHDIKSEQIAKEAKTCLRYKNAGEDSFHLTAITSKGDTLKSTEYYSEGGYKFIATVTNDSIKIEQNTTY